MTGRTSPTSQRRPAKLEVAPYLIGKLVGKVVMTPQFGNRELDAGVGRWMITGSRKK